MEKVTYRISPGAGSTFSVLITGPDGQLGGASGFASEADAQAWINQKKQTAATDVEQDQADSKLDVRDGTQTT